jgi:Kef-type K+ transport system membrane component KefB
LTATQALPTLLLIALAAVVAPILADASRRFVPVPEVVIQILLGVLIGPSVLALTRTSSVVTALSDLGLTYLMFLAGLELDVTRMREGHMGRATTAWFGSLVLALGVGAVLHGTGLVLDTVVVGLCLTTTALTTLLPILRDAGVLKSSSARPCCRSAQSESSGRSSRSPCCSPATTPERRSSSS